ncbi:MAG: hypothetical protein TYPL_1090 [Candidatus Tyloplasma litorale]|nr:MAG: hypothetical protein TYPL_1090 [Mycoplasmatales bacterium]
MEIIKLRKIIDKNKEISNVLKDCSDEFLLKNLPLILSALDPENINNDYKIELKLINNELTWNYVPNTKETKEMYKIETIKQNYIYKLPKDLEKQYLIDLNDVKWTNNKKFLYPEIKRVFDAFSNNKRPDNVKGFWISGSFQTGKSFVSIALLNMLAFKGIKVSFINLPEFIIKTQEEFSKVENKINLLEQAKSPEILVIDDVGSERPTIWFKENIFLPLIDHRLKSKKTTIFTSSLSINKYLYRITDRTKNPETDKYTNKRILSIINSLIEKEVNI